MTRDDLLLAYQAMRPGATVHPLGFQSVLYGQTRGRLIFAGRVHDGSFYTCEVGPAAVDRALEGPHADVVRRVLSSVALGGEIEAIYEADKARRTANAVLLELGLDS